MATLGAGLSKPAIWTGCRKGGVRQAFLEGKGQLPPARQLGPGTVVCAHRPRSVSPSILGDRGRPP